MLYPNTCSSSLEINHLLQSGQTNTAPHAFNEKYIFKWSVVHCQVYQNMLQLSHEKNPPTFHYTGWLIGILIMAYYNPYMTGQDFIPYITQPTRVLIRGCLEGTGMSSNFKWYFIRKLTANALQNDGTGTRFLASF